MGRPLTISFLVVVAMVLVAAAVSDAAPVYNPATGHWYAAIPGGLTTWAAAEGGAVSMGGHLVTINDAAEQAWLLAGGGFGAPYPQYWIGLNDIATEGTWVWTSGEPVTYTNWATGEPNNGGGAGNEDVVVMNWSSWAGLWNDVAATECCRTGIAEWAAVPEPGLGAFLLVASALVGLAASRRRPRR